MIENLDLLISEFKENRESLKNMILELNKLKEKIYIIFPDKVDTRYIRFFEEKVKATTALFNSILDIRKEINKSLKDEIELKRRLDEGEENDVTSIDIRSLAAKIELLNKKKLGESIEENI
jgi:hypothetical protein